MKSLRRAWKPATALALVSLVSLGLRMWDLGGPCKAPCNKVSDHALIFDEVYYVNAARIIDGIQVTDPQHYAGDLAGEDPNSEHPQLGKLMIAGSIHVFGDDPLGWRFPSLLLGSAALLLLYCLVVGAGGSKWLGVGAAALMAADNLLMVHSRIGTLDILVLTPMLASAALYVRGRYMSAGLLLGIAACIKLVAPYLVLVFLLFEAGRWLRSRRQMRRALVRWFSVTAIGAAAYLVLMTLMDRVVLADDPSTGISYGDVISHTKHMFSYAATLTGKPTGIASYAWGWLGDYRPISYLNNDATQHIFGNYVTISTTHFLGVINPVILLAVLPGIALAAVTWFREGKDVDLLGLAWLLGTYIPFLVASVVFNRISYLYYMVIVMPGLYVLAARLLSRPWWPRWVVWSWAGLLLVVGALLFPFVPVVNPNWV